MNLEQSNTWLNEFYEKTLTIFVCGCFAGTIFAPIYFMPGLLAISYLCYRVYKANSWKESAILGLKFGLGYYLVSIYWVSLAIRVYMDDFWWAIPFALFGLPLLLSVFTSMVCSSAYIFRAHVFYPLFFSIIWCFFEWVSSWFLTGFPWVLIGYSWACDLALVQITNVIGVYGLSLVIIHIFSNLYYLFNNQYCKSFVSIIYGAVVVISLLIYGNLRLHSNPTRFSNLRVRLVQPSIPQVDKWEKETLSENLNLLSELTNEPSAENVDMVIWPESALILPVTTKEIKNFLINTLKFSSAMLITGSVAEEGNIHGDDFKLYTAMQGVNKKGELLFEYYKSHLVPFGEYMPFSRLLAIKKLTHGFIDYSMGKRKIIFLPLLNLHVKPLICYEAIFPELVRYKIELADLIINITNDAWYGNSSGPYQHLQINVIRAIENGLPLLRVGNNGITAIIDPVGRIVDKINLNVVDIIDNNTPLKLHYTTYYTNFGELMLLVLTIFLALMQLFLCLVQKNLD